MINMVCVRALCLLACLWYCLKRYIVYFCMMLMRVVLLGRRNNLYNLLLPCVISNRDRISGIYQDNEGGLN